MKTVFLSENVQAQVTSRGFFALEILCLCRFEVYNINCAIARKFFRCQKFSVAVNCQSRHSYTGDGREGIYVSVNILGDRRG